MTAPPTRRPPTLAAPPPTGRHRRRRRPRLVLGTAAVLAAAVAAYLALPGRSPRQAPEPGQLHAQVVTVAPPPDPALLARLRAVPAPPVDAAPVVLTYHDISDRPGPLTVTPAHFAAQMRLLHDAGWTTITAGQLDRWLHGGALPPHPVLVTFDDGTEGVWRLADPVLAQYGQHAISFVITGFVGTQTPYYMNWPEIRALAASGRWDIESHTHLGHVDVTVDAQGHQGRFLTSRVYLRGPGRPETLPEYRRRVETDLQQSITTLQQHALPAPAFFAFPFAAASSTDAPLNGALAQIVSRLFHASMLDGSEVSTTSPADVRQRHIKRMDVLATTTLAGLVTELGQAAPTSPAASAPFSHPADWTEASGSGTRLALRGAVATLAPPAGTGIGFRFAAAASTWWHDYTVTATLGGFREAGDGTTTGLRVLAGTPGQVQVAVSAAGFEVRQGQGPTQRVLVHDSLVAATSHPVSLSVHGDRVAVTVDGRQVADVLVAPVDGHPVTGGIELTGQRRTEAAPLPTVGDLLVREP